MPLTYVPPEIAFEVRIMRNGEGIQVPWIDDPWKDPKTYDDQYIETMSVYFTYEHNFLTHRHDYRLTLDKDEEENNEFDIRDLPNHVAGGGMFKVLQKALDDGLVRIKGKKLIIVGGA
tara:strand:+ start:45 stop:398 length:354 start_codon:yes stop_codon:yes gene_type:complete